MWFKRRALTSAISRMPLVLELPFPLRSAAAADSPSPETVPTFSAFLGTLIPSDSTGPAASGIKLDETILRRVPRSKRWVEFINLGCNWLDKQARQVQAGSFIQLPYDARPKIVNKMAKAAPDSFGRGFFETWRHHAMRLYYAHPASWPTLGVEGPPQPAGRLDYAEPPRPL